MNFLNNITLLTLSLSICILVGCNDKFHQSSQTNVLPMDSITTLPSGLRYKIITKAPENAATPKKGQTVFVHYKGMFENGVEFDSSIKRRQPFSFVLGAGQVIKGWDEGVALMSVGDKWQLIIPANLAYEARGIPGVIPGNATLIFEVELLSIK